MIIAVILLPIYPPKIPPMIRKKILKVKEIPLSMYVNPLADATNMIAIEEIPVLILKFLFVM